MTRLGTRMSVEATDIIAGDFTTFSGYRRVSRVEHVEETFGRGKKRKTTLVAVKLHRVTGETADSVLPDAMVTIYRQEAT